MSSMSGVWNTVSSIVSLTSTRSFQTLRYGKADAPRLAVSLCRCSPLSAILLALVIIHSDYGMFSFSTIFFGLTAVPSAIPVLLGIMTRKISRWSAMASVMAGVSWRRSPALCCSIRWGNSF